LGLNFQNDVTVHAANLRFYNYSTGSNVNYSDKQITYTYNGRELSMPYPGILNNGTALADYEDLFVRELGLKAERKNDTIVFSDGTTELILTIGSKNTVVNGVSDTVSVAPVKLKFDNTIKYYVPTRYVAETFGFDYVWVSNISTVRITKTLQLAAEDKNFLYNGSLYSIKHQEKRIFTDMPAIYYKGSVMVPAKEVFPNIGCNYNENDNSISITKNELTLYLEKNSKTTYINTKKIIADSVPVKITTNSFEKAAYYVSLEFVADMLGFQLTYSDKEKCYSLTENDFTGGLVLYPDLMENNIENAAQDNKQQLEYQKSYFEWAVQEPEGEKKSVLYKVSAYALEHADVVELYGVSRNEINDFFDNGLAVFELKNVSTEIGTQFFSDDTAPHIKYAILSPLATNTKLFFMTPLEDKWYIEEEDACIRVYFMHEDTEHNSVTISSVKGTDLINNSPEKNLPDDKLLIPIPESVVATDITDEDYYLENFFSINISGNHVEFYQQHEIINPYYGIRCSNIAYDIDKNLTKISFGTKSIYGYQYTLENGYIYVTVGKPNEIYSKVIVLDAGHGGIDPGAIKNKTSEKDLNFKIMNTYVKDYFKNSDIKVYFTRDTDVKIELYDRANFTSEVGADLFISLHMNANNSSAKNGTEVYYSKDNNEKTETGFNSYQLAKNMVNNLSAALKSKNLGVKYADFIVLKYNTVPAVLIELGYMTNAAELENLKKPDYQKKAAETIYKTVLELYSAGFFR